MTDKEELALAILLWRSMRADFDGYGISILNRLSAIKVITDKAEEMASGCGVKSEFFQLLIKLPLLDVVVKNLDNEGKRKPRKRKGKNKHGG